MSELLLKSLDYNINETYDTLGVYCGIFNNSHLLFLYTVDWLKTTQMFKHEIQSIPTLNELIFINRQVQYGKLTYLSKFSKFLKYKNLEILNSKNKNILRRVITIDNLYYNPKRNNCLLTLRRIY